MSRNKELFLSFLKIGLFTFGGGFAMIPLIQREMIDRRGWIKRQEFMDLLTLAQSAPGPIALNTAVFTGYKMGGIRGAIASISGVIVPSFVIIVLVAIFFTEIRHNAIVEAAFNGMRPAVVALIIVPLFSLTKGLYKWLYLVALAVALIAGMTSFSPVYLLIAGAVAGIIWELYIAKKVIK